MTEITTFDTLVWLWISVAIMTFIILLNVTAPYGRHTSKKWGISIPNRFGWLLMELPALVIFLLFVITGGGEKSAAVWVITALFATHYTNRSIIFPLRIRTKGKEMPLLIALMAIIFNTVNATLLGYYTGTLQTKYTADWLTDPRFIIGTVLFLTGMGINLWADEKLMGLRKESRNGYRIPAGGLFNKISCPNFFGELVEWLGFAILCWSLPALSFFIWTFCNLVPRALDHHKWYKKQFPDYPSERKAVFPYIL